MIIVFLIFLMAAVFAAALIIKAVLIFLLSVIFIDRFSLSVLVLIASDFGGEHMDELFGRGDYNAQVDSTPASLSIEVLSSQSRVTVTVDGATVSTHFVVSNFDCNERLLFFSLLIT